MARDVMYYFNGSDFVELGDVQQGYNISETLDGTKDSAKYRILSYQNIEITPYTILRHHEKNWIVSHNRVNRYENEQGFMYEYEIQCLGFIELLNARDLTDCGFRANKYSVRQFVQRLFALSNCEHGVYFEPSITSQNIFDLDQVVEYNKVFENYTLLSALRELFNGFNCGIKARLQQNGPVWDIYLNIIPKSGDVRYTKLDIDDFDDVEAISNIDKNSYGSVVVTNAENVVPSKPIRFPVVGTTRLKSQSHTTDSKNACIMLPNNVFRATKLTLVPNGVQICFGVSNSVVKKYTLYSNVYDDYAVDNILADLISYARTNYNDEIADSIGNNLDTIKNNLKLANSFEFYDGFLYDAVNNKVKYPEDSPTGMKIIQVHNPKPTANPQNRKMIFTDKLTSDSMLYQREGIYWERGSNLIRGFDYFDEEDNVYAKQIDIVYSALGQAKAFEETISGVTYDIRVWAADDGLLFDMGISNVLPMSAFVEYIPMTNIKIKANNGIHNNNIQVYNQTGKLTDSIGLSKLINSYAKEITSEEITRNMIYYAESNLPRAGQLVNNNGIDYILNNISYEYALNEENWVIYAQVTMTKAVATKSLMVNADSNIRDYGIPQNYNVKRKEIYGNAWQVVYSRTYQDTNSKVSRFTLPLALDLKSIAGQSAVYQFKYEPSEPYGYVAFIECGADYPTYDDPDDPYATGSTSSYYYKLDCTKYTLKNQLIIMVDFQDNNIIGYDTQNISSGWSTATFFAIGLRAINTPVSYVDQKGELNNINISFVRGTNVSDVYNDYTDGVGYDESSLFDGSVFLDTDGEIFSLAEHYSDFEITATDYNKDALEVPVFEVSYQIISSDDVIVGENIFDNHEGEDVVIMYGWWETTQNVNEHNALHIAQNELLASDGRFEMEQGCEIRYNNTFGRFYVYPYTMIRYDSYEQKVHYTGIPAYEDTDFGGWNDMYDEVFHDQYPNGLINVEFSEFFQDISDVPDVRSITIGMWVADNVHESQYFQVNGTIDFENSEEWYVDNEGMLHADGMTWAIEDFDYSQWDINTLIFQIDSIVFNVRSEEDTHINFNANKNIIVIRYICGKVSQEVEKKELVFVAKKVPSSNIDNGVLRLNTNIYKNK